MLLNMQMQRALVLLAVSLTLVAAQPFLGGQNLLPGGMHCLCSASMLNTGRLHRADLFLFVCR